MMPSVRMPDFNTKPLLPGTTPAGTFEDLEGADLQRGNDGAHDLRLLAAREYADTRGRELKAELFGEFRYEHNVGRAGVDQKIGRVRLADGHLNDGKRVGGDKFDGLLACEPRDLVIVRPKGFLACLADPEDRYGDGIAGCGIERLLRKLHGLFGLPFKEAYAGKTRERICVARCRRNRQLIGLRGRAEVTLGEQCLRGGQSTCQFGARRTNHDKRQQRGKKFRYTLHECLHIAAE